MIPTDRLLHAQDRLAQSDPVMAALIATHGDCRLGAQPRDPFHVLAVSIINQQLSTKAADTIQARVEQCIGCAPGQLTAAALRAVEHEALRGCGLSNAKARWLHGLSDRVLGGELAMERIAELDDVAAIEVLDALPGVGRWTAEMMLMFAFHRLDVFSMGDVGLRRSINQLYNGGLALPDADTQALTLRWAPHRTVASWYLWRHADGNVGSWG